MLPRVFLAIVILGSCQACTWGLVDGSSSTHGGAGSVSGNSPALGNNPAAFRIVSSTSYRGVTVMSPLRPSNGAVLQDHQYQHLDPLNASGQQIVDMQVSENLELNK